MLAVNNVQRQDSWDSSRGNAHVHDLSGRVNDTPQGMNVHRNKSNLPNISGSKEYYAGGPGYGHSHNASAQQLSVNDQLAGIEEAVDLSARGSIEHHNNRGEFSRMAGNEMRLSHDYGYGGDRSTLAKHNLSLTMASPDKGHHGGNTSQMRRSKEY